MPCRFLTGFLTLPLTVLNNLNLSNDYCGRRGGTKASSPTDYSIRSYRESWQQSHLSDQLPLYDLYEKRPFHDLERAHFCLLKDKPKY